MIFSPGNRPTAVATNAPVVVLLAHPYPQQSRVNRLLAAAVATVDGVEVRDLYALYPDLDINVAREQAVLRAAELIVFQHPMYWYSAPALLKEWQDTVLARGFAIGRSGTALHGKCFLQVVSIGSSAHAYTPEGTHRYSVAELLRPYEQMARLCGMRSLPPIIVYDAHHSAAETLQRHAERYAACLRDFLHTLPDQAKRG